MPTMTDYKELLDPKILKRGRDYFKNGKVGAVRKNGRGTFYAKVKGTESYDVELTITKGGKISSAYCTCPYEYGEYCKHIAAVLMALEEKYSSPNFAKSSAKSSAEILSLLDAYKPIPDNKNDYVLPGTLRLEPYLYDSYVPELSLKIGCEKMYKVRDIYRLIDNFRLERYAEYGKYLAFTHSVKLLDERSRKLLELVRAASVGRSGYYVWENSVTVDSLVIDGFFELFRDEYIFFNDERYLVKFADPELSLTVKPDEERGFFITSNKNSIPLGKGRNSYFSDPKNKIIFAAGEKFTHTSYDLLKAAHGSKKLFVSKTDMSKFYTLILKNAADYVKINGLEHIYGYIPPELSVQLYVDCAKNNTIRADLMFCYDNNSFNAFSRDQNDHTHFDEPGEAAAKAAVQRYFSVCPELTSHTLLLEDDDTAYEFITNGIPELSKTMELYISDRLRQMTVRPAVKLAFGVRMSGGLLELEINDDNYSGGELAEILAAYRARVKYHRLKDGSFVIPDDSIKQLGEIAEILNISDKDLLRKKIKLPAYRMLYLNSLQNRKNVRVSYAENFKKAVSAYNTRIQSSADADVPDELRDVMRGYQKYGFTWLKTIAAYKFGGILADDMGLGKTIQALSLILDNKKCNPKALPALIVCPSSLTLNWEAEIQRFAPKLKTLTVIGTAAHRAALLEKLSAEKYDAVITSYALLTRDIDLYAYLRFSLHFIDEAQYIKNHNTQSSKAVKAVNSEVRFALTGTPVENSLAELWSAFDFIMPGYLFNYTHFKKTFETPIAEKKDENAVRALQSSVSPFILRRLKKDVLSELPDKTQTVLTAVMKGEQRKLYLANISALKNSVQHGLGSEKTDRVKILAALTRLREICCDPSLVYENFKGKSAKLEQCIELVENCVNSGHKILLFSQFTSMLEIISGRLGKLGISYYMLRGSTRAKDRIRLVNEFNENDVKVFLISLKAGGTGLNLTGADIVIHYDPWWNASAENQASDRAYRIGQRKNVQVYKLITRNSIEEKILELQQSKSELGSLICGENADITKMSADEILQLLK